MRTNLWIPVVVATAAAAGMVAFLAASPSGPERVPADETGFRELQQQRLEQVATDAAKFHREQALAARTVQQAKVAASGWLEAIAGSRTSADAGLPRGVRLGGATPGDARDVRAFVRWADDLPRSTWSSTTRAATIAGDRLTGTVTIPGSVTVTTFQATKRTRVDKVDLTLHMRPQGATSEHGPVGWTIVGLAAGPAAGSSRTTGVRALADPVIVVRTVVQVVAAREDQAAAVQVANHADTSLPYLRARYHGLGSAAGATLWLLPDAATAKRVLGAASTGTIPAGARAWTNSAGDVVLDMSALGTVTPLERNGVARHELTHVAMLPLLAKAPSMLLEGLALYEETHGVRGGTDQEPGLEPLQQAFADGTLGYQSLLARRAASFPPSVEHGDLAVSSLAGYATVAYVEGRFGHERVLALLAQLRAGTRLDRAVQNVLRFDTVMLQRRVRLWVDTQVDPPTAGGDAAAGTGAGAGGDGTAGGNAGN